MSSLVVINQAVATGSIASGIFHVTSQSGISESDLYAPVKALLESLGYEVKAEVHDCDVVATKDGNAPVVVELKLSFSLDLVLQGVDRFKVSDSVYLAVPAPDTATKRRNWRARQRGILRLCRMLGLGLILVALNRKPGRQTDILLDPGPYQPRKNKRQQVQLMKEFAARAGDPNVGGVTHTKIITSYRQDALLCAAMLHKQGEAKVSEIKAATGVERAASILQKNHYAWFERTARGIYGLTPRGAEELKLYDDVLLTMADQAE
jgi:hypothetical protein